MSLILLLHASDVIVLHCSLHALIGLVQRYDIINTFYKIYINNLFLIKLQPEFCLIMKLDDVSMKQLFSHYNFK
jgi:hypothetical protein